MVTQASAGRSGPRDRTEIRSLVEDPSQGWREVPLSRMLALYRGETTIPELSSRTIRVTFFTVTSLDGEPVQIRLASIGVLKLEADGRVNLDALQARIVERLDGRPTIDMEQLSDSEIRECHIALGLASDSSTSV